MLTLLEKVPTPWLPGGRPPQRRCWAVLQRECYRALVPCWYSGSKGHNDHPSVAGPPRPRSRATWYGVNTLRERVNTAGGPMAGQQVHDQARRPITIRPLPVLHGTFPQGTRSRGGPPFQRAAPTAPSGHSSGSPGLVATRSAGLADRVEEREEVHPGPDVIALAGNDGADAHRLVGGRSPPHHL